MDDSVNGIATAPSTNTPITPSFVNYDSHIRNNTLICNFIEYDNVLKEKDSGVSNDVSNIEDNIDENEPNNNNNLRIRMMKQVLNNEDNAMYHFTKQNDYSSTESEYLAESSYTHEQLEQYKQFLKNQNKMLKNEYSTLDSEFDSLYLIKERLLELNINLSLKDTSLDEKLLTSLIEKLEKENQTDLINLLHAFRNEQQTSKP